MNKFILFITSGWAAAITLSPFGIYVKEKYLNRLDMINHEKIHWAQQMELLIIFFYLIYGIEWFIRLFINGKFAYAMLSLEREAYDNEHNLDYLKTRKHFAWLKYYFKSHQ